MPFTSHPCPWHHHDKRGNWWFKQRNSHTAPLSIWRKFFASASMEGSVSFNTTTELGSLQDQNSLEFHCQLDIPRGLYRLVQEQNARSERFVVYNPRFWKASYLTSLIHLDRNSHSVWTYLHHPPYHAARVWQSLQKRVVFRPTYWSSFIFYSTCSFCFAIHSSL